MTTMVVGLMPAAAPLQDCTLKSSDGMVVLVVLVVLTAMTTSANLGLEAGDVFSRRRGDTRRQTEAKHRLLF